MLKYRQMINTAKGDDPQHRQVWTLNNSWHQQQSDVPLIAGIFSILMNGLPFSWSRMDDMIAHDLTARLSLQFIGKYLGKHSCTCVKQLNPGSIRHRTRQGHLPVRPRLQQTLPTNVWQIMTEKTQTCLDCLFVHLY